jgi:hypothetical protein
LQNKPSADTRPLALPNQAFHQRRTHRADHSTSGFHTKLQNLLIFILIIWGWNGKVNICGLILNA